jgi:hypothetical protein
MKSKSCFEGALVFGILAGLARLAQYIFTIGKDGYYLPGLFSAILNYTLVGLLAIGTLWMLICGFGGKKREIDFCALFEKNTTARLCFWGLGLTNLADGAMRLIFAEIKTDYLLGGLCILTGILWFLIERLALSGKSLGLLAILPALHPAGIILEYFWATHKYIHVSEYAMVILSLCAILLFVFAILKPAAGGASTGQRICATAGLAFILCCAGLLPLLPAFYLQGMPKETLWSNGVFFTTGLFYLILAGSTLKGLSNLPAPQPKEEAAPDLSALNEFISNLPEIEEE